MSRLTVAIWAEALTGPYTGTRTVLENLIRTSLESFPDRVAFTLICPSWADPKVLDGRFPEGPLRVVQVRGGRWPNRLAWLAGGASVTPVIGRHDLYLSGWQWPLGRKDEPFVAILHDLRILDPAWQDPNVTFLRRLAWCTVWDLSVRACVTRAAAIVAPSQYTLDHMSQLGYKTRQPTVVIPHGVDHEFWSVRANDAELEATLKRVGAFPGGGFILGLGQHTPHKNFMRLIEGFAAQVACEDTSSQLIIVGGENVETDNLRARSIQLGLENRITLAGTVTFQDLHVLMSRARIFAFPSLFEGFGLPVLEAFAAGTPVITSNTTSLGEIANEAAVLVDPNDTVEIGNTIARVWSDENLRSNLVEAGKTHVAKFRWEDATKQYLDLFEVAAGSSQGAR